MYWVDQTVFISLNNLFLSVRYFLLQTNVLCLWKTAVQDVGHDAEMAEKRNLKL